MNMSTLTLAGTMLEYGVPSMNGFVIPKECELTIPEKIPVAWNYRFNTPDQVIGTAEATVLEDRIEVTVKSANDMFNDFMRSEKKILCGGFWHHVKGHRKENGILKVESARLGGLGVYLDGDKNLYLEIKEE